MSLLLLLQPVVREEGVTQTGFKDLVLVTWDASQKKYI
jgi:hypothetical protein